MDFADKVFNKINDNINVNKLIIEYDYSNNIDLNILFRNTNIKKIVLNRCKFNHNDINYIHLCKFIKTSKKLDTINIICNFF